MQEQLVPCHVSLAHQIIYGAIDYAGQLRFEPQKDFKLSQYVLEERDHFDYVDRVEFGKDGKPLFISGPDDNSDRIMRQLETRVGQDNFDYIYGTNNPPVSTEF